MRDDGVAASVTEAVEDASQPAQQIAVPETAEGEEEGEGQDQPAVSPESPMGQGKLPASKQEDDVSEASPLAVPPAAPTPTPNLSPQGGKAADVPGEDDASAEAQSASATASRTICLRTLRGSTSSGALSSLAGWGGPVGVAAAAGSKQVDAGRGSPPPPSLSTEADAAGQAGAAVVVGGLGVLPTGNKVVDLREVKKVKPGPLATSAAAAAAAAAPVSADDSDGAEEGGGAVKIDISAGKRMIEFQLKQNAAEEKREAARIKSERERADAAAAESSQRMLAQVNARLEAQRRGRGGGGGGGVLGSWGSENLADHDGDDDGDWGDEAYVTPQSRIKNLAEKHGIVVKFVGDGDASGVAQVRALARAHGIRIRILGQQGGSCFQEQGEVETPAGGDGTAAVDGGDTVTPPPVLSSLRTRANTVPARRSPSPLPQSLTKAPPRKTPAPPAAGMFSGPARMMRRALEASGGCVPSGRDLSPGVAGRADPSAMADGKGAPASSSSAGDDEKVSIPSGAASHEVADPSAASAGGKCGAIRSRPGSAGSGGTSADAVSNGDCSNGEAAAATATPSVNAPKASGLKRRAAPREANQAGGAEGRGGQGQGQGHSAGGKVKRTAGGVEGRSGGGGAGSSSSSSGGGRMESRLGNRGVSPSGDDGVGMVSGRRSPDTSAPRIQSSAPKRMRLVAPSGVVVSQASTTPSASTNKPGRRASSGGAGWGAGNNNLFKGAMAGIMGRGKRPSP